MAQHTILYRVLEGAPPAFVPIRETACGTVIALTVTPRVTSALSMHVGEVVTAGGLCRPNTGDWNSSRDVSDPGLQPRGSFRPRPRGVAHVPAVAVGGAADPSMVLSAKGQSCR